MIGLAADCCARKRTDDALPYRVFRAVTVGWSLGARCPGTRSNNMLVDSPRFRVAFLIFSVGVSACGGRSSDPATVVLRSDTAVVSVPERVRAGERFAVSFTLFESGCRDDTVRTYVQVRGRIAEIQPRMGRASPDPCPAILSIVRRTATLRFDQPGEAVVSLVGVREGPPSDSSGRAYTRPVRVERRLRVLPAGR